MFCAIEVFILDLRNSESQLLAQLSGSLRKSYTLEERTHIPHAQNKLEGIRLETDRYNYLLYKTLD